MTAETETTYAEAIAVLHAEIDEESDSGNEAPELRQAIAALTAHDALLAAAKQAREAFHLTREYVGEDALPAFKGWSWYDADNALRDAIDAATGDA